MDINFRYYEWFRPCQYVGGVLKGKRNQYRDAIPVDISPYGDFMDDLNDLIYVKYKIDGNPIYNMGEIDNEAY